MTAPVHPPMERMNPTIKAEWVAALRSGEYEQGTDQLRAGNAFCCLGVLCDLYAKKHGLSSWTVDKLGAFGVDEEPNYMVRKWADLPRSNPKVRIKGIEACLSEFNDGQSEGKLRAVAIERHSFAQIADAIEEQL